MGIPFAGVAIAGSLITIQVPANGSATSLFIVGGAFFPGDTALFQSPDGTPQVLDFLTTTIDVGTLTPSNPITLQAQGFACTGIFSPELAPYISGSGFSGNGSIIIEGISAFFSPTDEFKNIEWWSADSESDFDTSGNGFIWLGKRGIYRKRWTGTDTKPVFNSVDRWLEMRGGGFVLETAAGAAVELNDSTNPLKEFLLAIERLTTTNVQVALGGVARGPAGRLNANGNGFDVDSLSNVDANFNGEYDTPNNQLDNNNDYPSTGGNIPADTPFVLAVAGDLIDDRPVTTFGRRANGSNKLEGNIVSTALFSDRLTEAERQVMVRWAGFTLTDRFSYSLAPDLPNYDVKPITAGGGGASSFAGQVPQTTITFSSIPSGWEGRAHQGSKTLKYESDITTGIFSYTPPAGEVVSYTFSKPGFLLERFDRAITQDQEIVLEPTPDPSWVEAS